MSGTALKKQDMKRECARKMMEWIEASRGGGASTTTVPITRTATPPTLSPTTPPQTPSQLPSSPLKSPSQLPTLALHVNPISLLQEHLQAQGFPASCIRYESEDTWNGYVSSFKMRATVQRRNGEVKHGWSG
ncbi:hypothetical protein M427DRAFT_30831 [Gonapodya prolifera JEL478]|uniref:Uncharacterized protein n=1 Tax=Gonapodya prolifera (strain JEL478) TaxID=1344416 RepID=A0A139AKG1_GONPJ|nr:hypothetical protein M427DRAFT_30831 [Gonapodya prolifera JEL478]|eukprot:KXS17024.1 hypothetical protein M427DRAFT_30831 [Gonapodya prolifera JEL478]